MSLLPDVGIFSDEEESVEERIVPYNEWHNNCYACGKFITEDVEERGQFVVHREEDKNHTAAVGLCSKCTRQFSTLIEHWEKFETTFDVRESEEHND